MMKKIIILIFLFLFILNDQLYSQEENLTGGFNLNYGYFNKKSLKEKYGFKPGIKAFVGYKTKCFGVYATVDYLGSRNKFSSPDAEETIKILLSGLEARAFFLKSFFVFIEGGKLKIEEATKVPKIIYDINDSWMYGGGIGYTFNLINDVAKGEILIRFTSSTKVKINSSSEEKISFGRNLISFGIFF